MDGFYFSDAILSQLVASLSKTTHRSGPEGTNRQPTAPSPRLILRWAYSTRAFVPTFGPQPFLERLQMNFRILSPKTGNVRLEASFIKPAKHLIKLFAQKQPH